MSDGVRRRWPRRLAVVVVLLVVVGVVAVEWIGRIGVDRLAADRIARDVPAESVEVVLGEAWWRPTVVPAALFGDVDRISVRLTGATLAGFPVAEVDYVLEGIDGNVSIADRQVSVASIDRGHVSMSVDPAAIASSLGAAAVISDGQLLVGPDRVPASFEIVGENLVVSVGDGTRFPDQVIPVVDDWLMPCSPEVALGERYLQLTCEGDRLPGVLGGTFSTDDLRGTGGSGGAGSGGSGSGEPPPAELEPPATVDLGPEDGAGD